MKIKGKRTIFLYAFLGCAVSLLISLGLYFFGVFDYLENKAIDRKMNLTANQLRVSDDICFIGVNQDSINKALKEKGWAWPWPREAYSQIIDFLSLGNAKCIVFDILFTEPSIYGIEDDEAFSLACSQNGRIVQSLFVDGKTVLFPTGSLNTSCNMVGCITSAKDKDDVIRRTRISYNYNDIEYPSLAFAPLLISEENATAKDIKLQEIKKQIPLLKDGTAMLHYKGDIDRYAHYSAWEIIESYQDYKNNRYSYLVPNDFEDCIVYVLLYSPGLFDICSSPVSQVYPGAGVHITALDNYLTNSFIVQLSPFFTVLFCLICSIIAGITALLIERINHGYNVLFLILDMALAAAIITSISFFAIVKNLQIPLLAPLISYQSSFIVSVFICFSFEGSQKRFIKNAFSQYLSPSVINNLLDNPQSLKLGGQKRNIAMFFSDIQRFSSLSEGMSPEDLTALLNKYLSEMTDIILSNGGTIDKYEGDAIIAFWNAPIDIQDYETKAVITALQCQNKLHELSSSFIKLCGRPLWTRIGLNCGDAVVGNMGSSKRFDYTMYGDSVNVASRLEGLNKQFGTYVLCTQNIKNAVKHKDIYFREIATVIVFGKTEIVKVYEPMYINDYNSKKEVIKIFQQGLDCFYKGQVELAKEIFDSIGDSDNVALQYSTRCSMLLEDKSLPRDGIWYSRSK